LADVFGIHDFDGIRGGPVLHRFRWFMIAFSMVLALAPLSGIITAAILAAALGCEINDAAMEPCIVQGRDFSALLVDLTQTAALGTIVFLILPFTMIAWAAVEGLARFLRWRRSG
jgi:hypothetical protein